MGGLGPNPHKMGAGRGERSAAVPRFRRSPFAAGPVPGAVSPPGEAQPKRWVGPGPACPVPSRPVSRGEPTRVPVPSARSAPRSDPGVGGRRVPPPGAAISGGFNYNIINIPSRESGPGRGLRAGVRGLVGPILARCSWEMRERWIFLQLLWVWRAGRRAGAGIPARGARAIKPRGGGGSGVRRGSALWLQLRRACGALVVPGAGVSSPAALFSYFSHRG